EEWLLLPPVEGQREVILARDVGGLLDPEPPDDVSADVEPEDLAGLQLGIGGAVCELHSARLAAAARQHLRLDDDRPAELLRRRARLLGRGREPTFGDRDCEAAEELLALILVEIHRRSTLPAWSGPAFRNGCRRSYLHSPPKIRHPTTGRNTNGDPLGRR